MYDKPYLQPNETMAFIIEWGGLILFLALVLSPFLIIRLCRFKPTKWRHIIGAYFGSFAVFFILFFIISKTDRWIYNSFINTHWIQQPLSDALFRANLWLMLIWPLISFYSTKLFYNKFTKKRFFATLLIAIVIFIILIAILLNAMAYGLGQIGSKYF